jgi:hypothetical protein
MSRRTLVTVVLAASLALVVALPAEAAASTELTGQWNRLSVDRSNPAPEHELLNCVQNNGAQAGGSASTWFCRYSKRPEPTLNFSWNQRQGFFSGRDITASWSCPVSFPTGACRNVVQVVEGTMAFTQPSIGFSLPVLQDLIVTQTPTGQQLYVYWVKQFVCPWFRTFDEALGANPLALPFNGEWPPQDCAIAA